MIIRGNVVNRNNSSLYIFQKSIRSSQGNVKISNDNKIDTLEINKVDADKKLKIYTKEEAGGKAQIAMGNNKILEWQKESSEEVVEISKPITNDNKLILEELDKNLFTEEQLKDIEKIMGHLDKNKFMNSSSVGSAAIVGLTIAQLEYHANNNLSEEQKNNLMETVRKNYHVGISQLEKQQQLTNYMRDKMKEEVKLKYGWELQEYSPSFKETKKYHVLEQFKELDLTDEEAFQNATREYENWGLKGTSSKNDYLINSVKEEINILQNMWNSFKEFI